MGIASERIVVMVTSTQKKAIGATAKRLGLNVSELIRRAAQGFQPKEDERELELFLDRVNASTEEANKALDDALAFVTESNRRIENSLKGAH